VNDCAAACRAHAGCLYFTYGKGGAAGALRRREMKRALFFQEHAWGDRFCSFSEKSLLCWYFMNIEIDIEIDEM
jgi:hypothetical protein